MKKKIYALAVMAGMLAVLLTGCTQKAQQTQAERTTDELYLSACNDAMICDSDEIEPLITITKDSNDVIWNDEKDKVLMLTYHHYPESYPDGEDVDLVWGQVWVTSAQEMIDWYKENKDGVEDWNLRLKELIGLPKDGEYTAVTAMWVSPEDMFRPAYVTDITKNEMDNAFEDSSAKDFDEEYKDWFDDNIIGSYFDDSVPWTRLGYTYDWADNGAERGLCEFVVNQDSDVAVEFTKDTDSFVKWLEEQQA